MSINATAVVKKVTKVDPKKPNDKASYASLSVLNEKGEEYGPPRHLGDFREVVALLRREPVSTTSQKPLALMTRHTVATSMHFCRVPEQHWRFRLFAARD
jgi:hypothetical protein